MTPRRAVRLLSFLFLLTPLFCSCALFRSADPGPLGRPGTLRTARITLDYSELGPTKPDARRRPLLLLTGYGVTKEMWNAEFVRKLAQNRRVLLLDNRGMGPNPAPEGPFAIADLARDAAALLDGLGIRRADVLGWSMGGMTAQELALMRPHLVAALVLYATAPESAPVLPAVNRMAAMSDDEFAALLFPKDWARTHSGASARLPPPPRQPDMSVIGRQYAAMRDWEGDMDRLHGLRLPVLILAGERDWVCPVEQGRRLAERIPRARLDVIADGGHWMMHQFPDRLARLVDGFLNGAAEEGPATAAGSAPNGNVLRRD